jgi:uncharacterized repeat protein (TIGR01451 family)
MKIFLTSFLSILLSTLSFSQNVTINDPGMVSWLTGNYPSCMSGNQLDTTCTDITTASWVTISNSYTILDLDGIQYFDALSTLNCSNNSVVSIPYLPQNMYQLIIGNNNLTSIPNIPSSLSQLDIRINDFTSLPPLPAGLTRYYGGGNPNLPLPTFPISITQLDISNCNLTSFPTFWPAITNLSIGANPNAPLPASFPPNLESLTIHEMGLTQLPNLPATVISIEAQTNNFVVLNNFPPNLEWLQVSNSANLDSMYNLPNSLMTVSASDCGLEYLGNIPASISALYIYTNNLTTLPTLPAGIDDLNVNDNQLTGFNYLPSSMNSFRANNNMITCMPIIPDVSGTTQFNFLGNPITCLPNYTNDMWSATLALPLCASNDPVNNPQGCSSAQGVSGYLFEDDNLNCARENSEQGIRNVPVRLLDNAQNQLAVMSSLTNGRFFHTAGQGPYEIVIDTLNRPIVPTCAIPGVDSSFVLTATDSLIDNVNFGFECKPGFDIGTTNAHVSGWVFPGQVHDLTLACGDLSNFYNLNCAQGISGTVTVTMVGPVNYVSNIGGTLNPTVSGLTFTYSIADFGTVDFLNSFGLQFETQTTAQSGDQICVNVTVTPTGGDNNVANNSYDYCYEVINSYDPNNKLVYPSLVVPGFDDYLTYTINFQNTGSAPAFNIRLEDTLSADLDLTTFEVIDYSHTNHYSLEGNLLQVYYPNIMLLDSTTNEPESKGYVTFKVKPLQSFVLGSAIENEASIYFDYNAPILTNTALVECTIEASLGELKNALKVYPVPFDGYFVLNGVEEMMSVSLVNSVGSVIWNREVSTTTTFNTDDLKSGIYFLKVSNGEEESTMKLLKK